LSRKIEDRIDDIHPACENVSQLAAVTVETKVPELLRTLQNFKAEEQA
jgi:hypothetical protein